MELRLIRSGQMTMNLPRGNEVDLGQRCPWTTNHHVNAR